MKKRYIIPLAISLFMVLLNVIARLSTDFSDFYMRYIFHYISVPFSFLSGMFPFSVGEFLQYLGALILIIGLPVFIILLIFRKKSRRKVAMIGILSIMWILTYILTTETLNCFIMYRCTKFSDRYFPETHEHNDEEFVAMYRDIIEKCNELAPLVERDENGYFILTDDLTDAARSAMKKASEKYPELKGYYPRPKPIMYSYFYSQSGILGIYYPYTMESNYNRDIMDICLPSTICHEYSHLKGFILEDEANFISFIATVLSDSTDFRYSGYIGALEYVRNQAYDNDISEAIALEDTISPLVAKDAYCFLPESYFEENKQQEFIPTETVKVISDTAVDSNLKFNGVEDGIKSYNRMVNLLLDYYFPS